MRGAIAGTAAALAATGLAGALAAGRGAGLAAADLPLLDAGLADLTALEAGCLDADFDVFLAVTETFPISPRP